MKYCIAIFPPNDVQDLANSYRKRYDPQHAFIPPHIKLKPPFELMGRNLDDIIQHLEEVAASSARFHIELYKVSTFHPTTNVVYFAIRDEKPLIELHNKCNSGILYDEEAYKYVPHLTIGQELSKDELQDVYGRLRLMNINATFDVSNFHLLYKKGDGTWTVSQSFHLKNQQVH